MTTSTNSPTSYRVRLVNCQTLGAMCGCGYGPTREAAIESALKMARERDPNAYYEGGAVMFAGGVNC